MPRKRSGSDHADRAGSVRPKRENGEGSVYRAGKYFKASVTTPDGRISRSAKTEERAYEKLQDLLLLRQQGLLSTSARQTVEQYLAHWIRDIKADKVKYITLESYIDRVNHLRPLIGTIRLGELRPADVNAAYATLTRAGYSAQLVNAVHRTLRAAMNDAIKEEIIMRNPAARPATLPRIQRTELHTLSSEQLSRLFDGTVGTYWHALWVVLGTTGMRVGEALALTTSSIEGNVAQIVATVAANPKGGLMAGDVKTRASRRSVRLTSAAQVALKAHRALVAERELGASRWDGKNLIWPNKHGSWTDPQTVLYAFRSVCEQLGLPRIRVHDLRHTMATLLLQNGVHPKVVQEMLGHSSITTTLDRYSHVAPTMHQAAADAMDDLLRAAK